MTGPPSSSEDAALWVRRCAGCDECDLNTAVGSEALIDDIPWRCRRCGAVCWIATRLSFPANPSTRCPHRGPGPDKEHP